MGWVTTNSKILEKISQQSFWTMNLWNFLIKLQVFLMKISASDFFYLKKFHIFQRYFFFQNCSKHIFQ